MVENNIVILCKKLSELRYKILCPTIQKTECKA